MYKKHQKPKLGTPSAQQTSGHQPIVPCYCCPCTSSFWLEGLAELLRWVNPKTCGWSAHSDAPWDWRGFMTSKSQFFLNNHTKNMESWKTSKKLLFCCKFKSHYGPLFPRHTLLARVTEHLPRPFAWTALVLAAGRLSPQMAKMQILGR